MVVTLTASALEASVPRLARLAACTATGPLAARVPSLLMLCAASMRKRSPALTPPLLARLPTCRFTACAASMRPLLPVRALLLTFSAPCAARTVPLLSTLEALMLASALACSVPLLLSEPAACTAREVLLPMLLRLSMLAAAICTLPSPPMLPVFCSAPLACTVSAPALAMLPLLSSAVVLRLAALLLPSSPALLMPPVVCTASRPVAVRLPLFSSRPSAVTTAWPTDAPMLPALRTPTPCSVEVR